MRLLDMGFVFWTLLLMDLQMLLRIQLLLGMSTNAIHKILKSP